MPILSEVKYACNHVVESTDSSVLETAVHWLCPKCTAKRNGLIYHDWTEEEIFLIDVEVVIVPAKRFVSWKNPGVHLRLPIQRCIIVGRLDNFLIYFRFSVIIQIIDIMKLTLGLETTEEFILSQGYMFLRYKGGDRKVFSHPDHGSVVFKPRCSFGYFKRNESKGQIVFVTSRMDGKAEWHE